MMGGCAAINCTNHSRKGSRMVRFPSEIARRSLWIANCRRDEWTPGPSAQLCIDHFEECQFEKKTADDVKKLKRDAVPTLFSVPNPPPKFASNRVKGVGYPKPNSLLSSHLNVSDQENSEQSGEELRKRIAELEKMNERLTTENESLKNMVQEDRRALSSFLSDQQIASLKKNRSSISQWSQESIIKTLKIRFALGKHGFNYLRETGYPLPSYSTLNKRIQHIRLDFGVLKVLFLLLKAKIDAMEEADKNCALLIDEMEIAKIQEFDVSSKSFVGNVTLGQSGLANHYTVVMLRGLKSPWKQVVSHELTGPSTDGFSMRQIVSNTVVAARNIGLKIRASTSDMGSNNKAMWSTLGVSVTRNERKTSYVIGNTSEAIHAFADVPHLIKNMRKAFLTRIIILPSSVRQEHDLPSNNVSSGFLKQLWSSEVNSDSALRSLHHLHKSHLFPTHFNSMNVALAVQLFSIKTAAALEKAVRFSQISRNALATAWWIRILAQWFNIMTARHLKCAITKKNKDEKFQFLNYFITLMQNVQLGKGWKPLQTGMILSTLSVLHLSEELFSEGFSFFLPGRLTQDALENVFGQIRRRSGSKPTALKAKGALRLICLSQFISDIKNSNYSSDSDHHLLDVAALDSSVMSTEQNTDSFWDPLLEEENIDPNVSAGSNSQAACSSKSPLTIAAEENEIYYIAGATLNALLKKKSLCKSCLVSMKDAKDIAEPDVPKYRTLLTEYCDMGGLQKPESGLYRVCREAERAFKKNKDTLLQHQLPLTDDFIRTISDNCQNVFLPTCCNLKEIIIKHYLVIRCKGLINCITDKKATQIYFGSASANKKQRKE